VNTITKNKNLNYGVINMNTTEILQKTEKLVNDSRAKTHGDKIKNHENIARLWSSYLQNKTQLNIVLSPEDVAQLMTLLKIARSQAGEHNIDDYIDGVGYQAIAGEIANKRSELSSSLGVSNERKSKNTDNK
jgi:hypothetical protein